VREVRALIDELSDEKIRENILRMKMRFPPGVTLNMSKLIVCGHSFGGITALDTSRLEPERVATCLTMDPWLFTRHADILENNFNLVQPMIAISSEEFHPRCEEYFASWKTLKHL
jgi:pimeloyl-ACP methyl ester carboxylesterase